MKRTNNKLITIKVTKNMLLAMCVLLFSLPVCADYEINWHTIDGGGGQSSGGPYTLTGTIGQPDAAYSAGDNYELLGGFWPGGPLCIVDFQDFARFAQYWLQSGSDLPADLYKDDTIDEKDLREFCQEWLYQCPYGWTLR